MKLVVNWITGARLVVVERGVRHENNYANGSKSLSGPIQHAVGKFVESNSLRDFVIQQFLEGVLGDVVLHKVKVEEVLRQRWASGFITLITVAPLSTKTYGKIYSSTHWYAPR